MPTRLRCKRQCSRILLIALAYALVASPAHAAGRSCLPVVRDAWVRLPPVSMPMLAGFGRIDNDCAAPLVIVGASSPAFGRVELHQSTVVDGVSRMRAVPRLHLAGHGDRQMKPGGLHLMLIQPRAMPVIGDTLAVDFELADGRRMRGEFEVRAASAL